MKGKRPRRRRGALAIAGAILYWLAVVAISLALVVGLILLLESRDESEIEGAGRVVPAPPVAVLGTGAS